MYGRKIGMNDTRLMILKTIRFLRKEAKYEAAGSIELLQTKLTLIERIVNRLATDRDYCTGDAADELQEVLDGNHHIGAWYE